MGQFNQCVGVALRRGAQVNFGIGGWAGRSQWA
jgi:hypothetical protein